MARQGRQSHENAPTDEVAKHELTAPARAASPIDAVLRMQASAGNRATGAALARRRRPRRTPPHRTAALQDAVISGRRIPRVTIETEGMTITLTDVLATQFQTAGAGDAPLVSVEFEGDSIHYRDAAAEHFRRRT